MTAESINTTGVGRIARVIGPVVDVEFPPDQMPAMYNALEVDVDLSSTCLLYTSDAADDCCRV